jgi:hypothetical protein
MSEELAKLPLLPLRPMTVDNFFQRGFTTTSSLNRPLPLGVVAAETGRRARTRDPD